MIQYFLYAHILFGSISLITGMVATLSKKGGKLHIQSGKIFAISMLLTCAFSLYISISKSNIFLLCIAFFSYYSVFIGQRYIKLKRLELRSSTEKIALMVGGSTALGMIAAAAFYFFEEHASTPAIILMVFGILYLLGVIQDYYILFKQEQYAFPKQWLTQHISKMGGGYIATITAFVVVNNNGQYIPDLVSWFGPGVIGGFFIARATRKIISNK